MNALVARLEALGILREITGQKRNRRFCHQPYVELFGEAPPQEPSPALSHSP
jgi:hypothetical protein